MTDNTARLQESHVSLDDMLDYLDDLRAGGTINMFGARPHLQAAFGLTTQESKEVHKEWMETFGKREKPAACEYDFGCGECPYINGPQCVKTTS